MSKITQRFQGDVALIEGAEFPKELSFKSLPNDGKIVAYGEVTGHVHRIVAVQDSKVEIAEKNGRFYLNVIDGSAVIKHEEHAAQTLAPGKYTVFTQVEYDDLEELRKVSD